LHPQPASEPAAIVNATSPLTPRLISRETEQRQERPLVLGHNRHRRGDHVGGVSADHEVDFVNFKQFRKCRGSTQGSTGRRKIPDLPGGPRPSPALISFSQICMANKAAPSIGASPRVRAMPKPIVMGFCAFAVKFPAGSSMTASNALRKRLDGIAFLPLFVRRRFATP
jgi:hypothetical protein